MYLAMNRFRIVPGKEEEFEAVWTGRERHLNEVEGYLSFRLLRGPSTDAHTLYATHTMWQSREAFEGWLKSPAFRAAHKGAGETKSLYLGPPEFEGFETVIEEVD